MELIGTAFRESGDIKKKIREVKEREALARSFLERR